MVDATDDMMDEDTEKTTPPPLIENPDRAELEAKLTEAEDRALRAVAEMQNIRNRAERDITEAHKYGVKKLLEELIPVLDSLEHATNAETSEGLQLTIKMLQKVLEKFGVKEINPLNQPFNPVFHEAMTMQPSDAAPNTVINVLQKGYQLHERVIRPARVIVSKAAT